MNWFRNLSESYIYLTESQFWPDWARSGSMISAIQKNKTNKSESVVGHIAHIEKHPEFPEEGYSAHIMTDGGHVHTFFMDRRSGTPRRGDRVELFPYLQQIPGAASTPRLDLAGAEYERYQGRAEDVGTHADTGEPIIGTIEGPAATAVSKFYEYMRKEL